MTCRRPVCYAWRSLNAVRFHETEKKGVFIEKRARDLSQVEPKDGQVDSLPAPFVQPVHQTRAVPLLSRETGLSESSGPLPSGGTSTPSRKLANERHR